MLPIWACILRALLFLLRGHAIAPLVEKITFALLLVLLFQAAPFIAAAVCAGDHLGGSAFRSITTRMITVRTYAIFLACHWQF